MNGIHDMGGMHGFGRVEREEDEPVFHAAWEARVLGLSRACSARHLFNIDESRHAIERMAPADYLASSYYERWLDRNVRLLVEKGVITREELERRMAQLASGSDPAPPHSDPKLLRAHAGHADGAHALPSARAAAALRASASGVLTRHDAPAGPHAAAALRARQARRHRARARLVHLSRIPTPTGRASSPTRSTASASRRPSCGASSAEPRAPVHLDLWERYLEPASPARSRS